MVTYNDLLTIKREYPLFDFWQTGEDFAVCVAKYAPEDVRETILQSLTECGATYTHTETRNDWRYYHVEAE